MADTTENTENKLLTSAEDIKESLNKEVKELDWRSLGNALEQQDIQVSKTTKASMKVYKSGDRTSTCLEFEDHVLEQQLLVFPSVVSLNVGGYNYTSTAYTLTQYPKSVLAQMCNGIIPVPRDLKGQQFIDRDGATFRYILTFLRTGKLTVPEGYKYFRELLTEAEFYRLEPLVELIKGKIKEGEKAKEKGYLRLRYNKKTTKGVVLSGTLKNLQEIIPDVKAVGGTLFSGKEYHFGVGPGFEGSTEPGGGDEGVSQVAVKGAQMVIPLKSTQVDALVQLILSHGYDVKGSAVAFDENDNKAWIFVRN